MYNIKCDTTSWATAPIGIDIAKAKAIAIIFAIINILIR